ncbi:ABC-type transport system, substrate-binding protein [Sulfobacillus thermosulfidooxidans DSM 9293]|uniref:ABC-type transport system, substrate-binding protein n=1 Tax=Sulfobacillus thermosulfidooxidans (strain DSM 9293 / VKM B-1269 / AT-1) TaxID=929705 RepID=A0A1W1WK00_SULTA|nr:ABC transporter substrate-binding protein [Sulfobacillus thermosulfidooxidans]SMC06489.1 ABC-type transport system, substrate-binding protein [Sulfobacillus thermosulfidooxidans DSM 9293]
MTDHSMPMRKRIQQWMGLLSGLMVLTGCGTKVSLPHPRIFNRPQIVLGFPRFGLNPFQSAGQPHDWIMSVMYDSLVKIRPNGNIAPDIADKWQIKNHYTVYIFHLNPHAKWWNGRPISVHDVAWSYELYANPKAPIPASQSLASLIRNVHIINASTIEIQLRYPDPSFLADVAGAGSGHWILPAFMVHNVRISKIASSPVFNKIPDMMGSGPYRPVMAYHGGIKWIANPHYFLGAPKTHALITTWDNSPTPDINWTSQTIEGQPRVLYYQGPEYYMLLYNMQDVPSALAKALPGLINRIALARAEAEPFVPAYEPLVPGSPYHVSPPQINPHTILMQAGYQEIHGEWSLPHHPPLSLTVLTGNSPSAMLLGIAIHHQLALSGIANHVVTTADLPSLLTHHAFMVALIERRAYPYPLLAEEYAPMSPLNYGEYRNFKFQHSLKHILNAPNLTASTQNALGVLLQSPPGVFLLWRQHQVFVNTEVQGFEINVFDPLSGIRHWRVHQQKTP